MDATIERHRAELKANVTACAAAVDQAREDLRAAETRLRDRVEREREAREALLQALEGRVDAAAGDPPAARAEAAAGHRQGADVASISERGRSPE